MEATGSGSAAVRGMTSATAQLAVWIGALVTTHQMRDKTWFAVLLAGGPLVPGGVGYGWGLAA